MARAWTGTSMPLTLFILVPEGLSKCCPDQVLATSQRVAGLRSTVPAALAEHLKGSLEQCRPTTSEQAEAAAEAVGASPVTPAPAKAMTPAPSELQGKFTSATAQIPALRYGQRQHAYLPCQCAGRF